ncbi:MAG: DUF3378 domain-containing protein [Mollicutes bacterium]|nr:MAG: DUF3378 domain-containing protein [Mollicutes bacterium]
MKTLKLTKSEIKRIIAMIPEIEKKQDQFKEYFFAKLPGLTIHIYQTGTLLLQGNENSIENFLKKIKFDSGNSKKTQALNY